MASFLNIIRGILPVLGRIEHTVAPIAETIFPAEAPFIAVFDGWVQRAQTAIAGAEASAPSGAGPAKSTTVIADFEAGLQMTQSILALTGQEVIYDKAALQAAIDAQVAAYSAFAKVKESFVIQKIPPATPAVPGAQGA